MRSLGFSVGHDKGAAIIEDGKLLVAITQERLSRIKHDGAYSEGKIPSESIQYCLNYLNLTFRDIDIFVYSTTEISDDVESQMSDSFVGLRTSKLLFIPHHLAHACSSFYSSNFEDSAVIVADASGSILSHLNKMTQWYDIKNNKEEYSDSAEGISIYHFTKKDHQEVYKKWIKYPVPIDTNEDVSLGTLYSEGSLQLVYEPNKRVWPAGKLMGMASYANQDIVNDAPLYVQELDDDIFIPNNRIFPKVSWHSDFFSKSCVAGIYQREQERASLILAKMAKRFTNSKNLCVAGGSFLNCNSNEKILNSNLFDNCFFIPPADDSGIPLGCAWYGYQQLCEIGEIEILKPYTGKKYEDADIVSALNKFSNLQFEKYQSFDELIDFVSYWLTQNRVIGWFQDSSELGPRALGNRSILASPIEKWMSNHINSDIKKREWYRPFAPAVMYEYQSEIFESDVFSPYMLLTTTVKKEWRDKIPVVVHIDNSARHQSVTNESNHKFYQLLNSFYQKTNVPVLLNTSFNGPHEPIVETPEDAINAFISLNLDLLVMGNYVLKNNIL